MSWWSRLIDEGHDILVWVDPGKGSEPSGLRRVGDGLVPKASGWAELLEWAKDGGPLTLMLFDSSGHGDKADEARKAGIHVVGGCPAYDRMEKEREHGFDIMERMGAALPEYQDFSSLSDGIAYAESLGEQGAYFKSDAYIDADLGTFGAKNGEHMVQHLEMMRRKHGNRRKFVIQDKIDGVAFSTNRWFNGTEFVGPFSATIEHKKFLNDDLGPSTGCSLNAVWAYPNETCEMADKLGWENLSGLLRQYDCAPGLVDINAVVDEDGNAYVLEFTNRLGFDSEPTWQRLVGDLGRFIWYVGTGQGDTGPISDNIAYAVRLSVPPYPTEGLEADAKCSPVGRPVYGTDGLWDRHFIGYQLMAAEDGLAVAAPEGIVGLSLATSRSLEIAHRAAIEYATDDLRCPGLQFRTDGDRVIAKDAKALTKVLGDIPGGLLR